MGGRRRKGGSQITMHHLPVYDSVMRKSNGDKALADRCSALKIDGSLIRRIVVGASIDGDTDHNRVIVECGCDRDGYSGWVVEAWIRESPQYILDSLPVPVPIEVYSQDYTEDEILREEEYVEKDCKYISRALWYLGKMDDVSFDFDDDRGDSPENMSIKISR